MSLRWREMNLGQRLWSVLVWAGVIVFVLGACARLNFAAGLVGATVAAIGAQGYVTSSNLRPRGWLRFALVLAVLVTLNAIYFLLRHHR